MRTMGWNERHYSVPSGHVLETEILISRCVTICVSCPGRLRWYHTVTTGGVPSYICIVCNPGTLQWQEKSRQGSYERRSSHPLWCLVICDLLGARLTRDHGPALRLNCPGLTLSLFGQRRTAAPISRRIKEVKHQHRGRLALGILDI